VKKPWIGRALIAVGVIHTLFGLVSFRGTLGQLVSEGLWNTVHGQPEREYAFWFLVTGLMLLLFGGLVHSNERGGRRLPPAIAWGLLLLTVAIVVIMPVSGGWLLLPPAIGAVLKRSPRTGP
jgi:hypothetical protein